MPSPSVETMWQEIRALKSRVCELEEQLAQAGIEDLIDVWIDYDDIPVADADGSYVLHGQ
jgi:hypothetical protein